MRDPDGYPPLTPPWGTLNAIDLNRGEIRWQIPFGEYPELVAKGIKNTGSDNYGGPVVTKSGLLFIGATNFDKKFRAYDKLTGKLLWETVLPAAGNATPSVYEIGGREYIAIVCGGGKNGAPSAAASWPLRCRKRSRARSSPALAHSYTRSLYEETVPRLCFHLCAHGTGQSRRSHLRAHPQRRVGTL